MVLSFSAVGSVSWIWCGDSITSGIDRRRAQAYFVRAMSNPTLAQTQLATIKSKALLGVALVIGLGFVGGFVLPYFRLTPEALGRYLPLRAWLVVHITTGTIALLLGPFVLGMGMSRRRMSLHRRLGYLYMASIGLGSISAFYLAFRTDVSWVFGMGLAGLGVAWIVTTGLAFLAIKSRLLIQHKEWMVRSYVVTFGFVNFRILVGILQVAGVGSVVEQLTAASWSCWAFPLLMTEAILQGRKIAEP
jgi:hypothetical protein